MEIHSANNWFPLKIWVLTVVVIGPILYSILIYFSKPVSLFPSNEIIIVLRTAILFGLLFSLPVFGIYFLLYKLLTSKNKSPFFIKVFLTAISILGMYITFFIMSAGSNINFYYTLPYPISVIISSLILKVYK